jgi:hypothetical protein
MQYFRYITGIEHMFIWGLDFVFFFQFNVLVSLNNRFTKYSNIPIPMGNTFQDLPQLHETVDNTERYI